MTSSSAHSILEVTNLVIGYQQKKDAIILSDGISFKLNAGSLIGLVGANGIGKSTLLRTLTGMQASLGGAIEIDGKSILNYESLDLAKLVSVVLTEAPSSKNLSVGEFVALGRQPHTNWLGQLSEIDLEKISNALFLTDTKKLVSRKCFELSDGQLQRVAIARALAQDTPVIVLDEPTTHLDLYHRAIILKLLKKLAKEMGKTILFSTHEIDLAIQLSDRMMVMVPNAFHFDDPCTLISNGAFTSLFPEDTILFDGQTGRFTIKD